MRLALALVLLFVWSASQAQAVRVRGTISAFDGRTLTLEDKQQIQLGEKTEIVFSKPMAISEIRAGDFLALTSSKRPDGTLTAYEVRRFPKPLNPGHRPFDGRNDRTMTNATVGTMVQAANGRELTMTYDGGAQKILVPENAAIFQLVPGERSQLVPGAPVSLTHDASRVALRIQVSAPAN